jgi:hypothetical protein
MIAGYISLDFKNPNQDIPDINQLYKELIELFEHNNLPIPKIEFCQVYPHPSNPLVTEYRPIQLNVQRPGETNPESESTLSQNEPGIDPEN